MDPYHQRDLFGNPAPQQYDHSAVVHESTVTGDGQHQQFRTVEEHHHTGILHRSGSGSSSSSEDDGQGGRRKKKGLMEKIKEKLPGGHKKHHDPGQAGHLGQTAYIGQPGDLRQPGHGATTTTITTATYDQHEDKGFMEKLPGHH